MKPIILTISTLFILLFSGCSTKYGQQSFKGGYSETRLSENIFIVTFKGNAFISKEEVSDYLLLRNSELTLNNGYKYFAIVTDDLTIDEIQTGSTYKTTGKVSATGHYKATTRESRGSTLKKPTRQNKILCFKEKREDIFVYDAKFIQKNLKKKYELD